MAVTLRDIAKEVNLSYGTVSRALSDDTQISEKTRQKIKLAARKLRYRPHSAGRALRTGKTQTIGLILPDVRNPFHAETYCEVQRCISSRGYRLISSEYSMDPSREMCCFEEMIEHRCDGVIAFISRYKPLQGLLEELWEQKTPCLIDGLPHDAVDAKVDSIGSTIDEGLERAVKHLVDLGHHHIVLLGSFPPGFTLHTVVRGFYKALTKCGLKADEDSVVSHYSGDQLEDGYNGVEGLLRSRPQTTAIIAVNDLMATGVMRRLMELGLRVPQDVSLVGSDNTWISKKWPISLTSIDTKTIETAQKSVEAIFERFQSKEWYAPRHINIATDLVVRESTGPVRKEKILMLHD